MELLPIGPVLIVDTPGFDDEGGLGEMRVQKTKQILNRVDVAVLVTDATQPLESGEAQMIILFREKQLPYLVVRNKGDLLDKLPELQEKGCLTSAVTGQGIEELKERIARLMKTEEVPKRIVGDLVNPSDVVILVVPIDSAAPKGRLILPQQQTIRDLQKEKREIKRHPFRWAFDQMKRKLRKKLGLSKKKKGKTRKGKKK